MIRIFFPFISELFVSRSFHSLLFSGSFFNFPSRYFSLSLISFPQPWFLPFTFFLYFIVFYNLFWLISFRSSLLRKFLFSTTQIYQFIDSFFFYFHLWFQFFLFRLCRPFSYQLVFHTQFFFYSIPPAFSPTFISLHFFISFFTLHLFLLSFLLISSLFSLFFTLS